MDATLLLLDPGYPGAIPNKRHVKRIKLFRQGPGELATAEVATPVLAVGARRTMVPR